MHRVLVGQVVVATAAACGSVPAATEPRIGTVVVSVVDDAEQPLGGIDVVFHRADGTILAHQTTAAGDGKTRHDRFETGGFVTIASEEPPANRTLRTFGGVKVGDQLRVPLRERGVGPSTSRFTVTLPAYAGATFRVDTSCGV